MYCKVKQTSNYSGVTKKLDLSMGKRRYRYVIVKQF